MALTGLTNSDVQIRVERGDVNIFESRGGRTYLQIIRHNIFNVFNLLLFSLLLIVLLSQDYWTVLFAGFSVLTNLLIGSSQEINAKRKLNELANLAPKQVEVLRDGIFSIIKNEEIVTDDVIRLRPGDRVVVDGKILQSDSLEIDESHMTGESDAIYKNIDDSVTSGSFCIAGSGLMIATRVGGQSTLNKITATAKVYKNTLTPTQHKIAAIVKITLTVMFIFAPMVFINGYLLDIGFLNIVKNTIVFTTSLVPQGMILTATLALTIGAVKITRHQTLIQQVNAVESMANVTVLCFDKTGTLTENKLKVDTIIPLDGHVIEQIETALQAYIGNLAHRNTTAESIGEYVTLSDDMPIKLEEIPFTSIRKWGAITFENVTYLLGAPEHILGDDDALIEQVNAYSQEGLRVLAFAKTEARLSKDQPLDFQAITGIALITISDHVRDDIKDTLTSFIEQSVRPKVISGDNPHTVSAIAEKAGMNTSLAYTGAQLDAMPDSEFDNAVQEADVFARVAPDTKRRIIASLRQQGEYVAMVGDGVNDVPALKEADLAVVMNDGAQISKDVAGIVLLNNAMSTLPLAFQEGTEITRIMFGTTKMFLTKNVYNTFMFIFILLMGLPFPITPIQISWASFGTVNIPGGLFAFGLIKPEKTGKFRRDALDYIITGGLTGAVGISFMYAIAYTYTEQNLGIAQSVTTIFFILYSLMIFLFVCGIDIASLRTYTRYPLATAITLILTSGAIIAATLFPDVFEFQWPPLELLFLEFVIFVLCALLVSIGMRNRGLLYQFYSLVEKDS